MNERQQEYFRNLLLAWKKSILTESESTLAHLQDGPLREPDLNDRASSETDWGIELRPRDRQRKLISKIDDALRRMALRLARFIAALEKRNSELDIALTESESTNRQLGEVIKTLETKLNGKADKADPQPSEGIAPTVEPSEPKQENAQ